MASSGGRGARLRAALLAARNASSNPGGNGSDSAVPTTDSASSVTPSTPSTAPPSPTVEPTSTPESSSGVGSISQSPVTGDAATASDLSAASSTNPPPSARKAALLAKLRSLPSKPRPAAGDEADKVTAEVTAKVERLEVSQPTILRPDREPVIRHGTEGKPVEMTANYVRMRLKADKSGVHEYEVRFDPIVDSRKERFRCLRSNEAVLGSTRTFDGVKLFLPHRLDEDVSSG